MRAVAERIVRLPDPLRHGRLSLEEAIAARRSVREFRDGLLDARQLSALLWATQGIVHPDGLRTAPSAGALYPLEVYVALADGLHHYEPRGHLLASRRPEDVRDRLYRAALRQECVREAAAVFAIAAVARRTERKYGADRALRYVDLEVGHAAQNLLLQAAALGLGAVPVGAYEDDEVDRILGLPHGETVRYLVPVGYPRSRDTSS
jgi:SagB-type dehydrogenase family enzyme